MAKIAKSAKGKRKRQLLNGERTVEDLCEKRLLVKGVKVTAVVDLGPKGGALIRGRCVCAKVSGQQTHVILLLQDGRKISLGGGTRVRKNGIH